MQVPKYELGTKFWVIENDKIVEKEIMVILISHENVLYSTTKWFANMCNSDELYSESEIDKFLSWDYLQDLKAKAGNCKNKFEKMIKEIEEKINDK